MEGPDTLHFQDISAAESAEEEEDRSDEIKQLLTEAFSNETFDDDSETSYAAPDTSNREDGKLRLSGSENGLNRLLPASANKVLPNTLNNGNGDSGHYFRNLNGNGGIYRNGSLGSFFSGIGVDSEDVNVLNGNLNGVNKKVRFHTNSEQNLNFLSNGNGRQADRGVEEIEVTNETVSMLHQKHCPQNGNNGVGDQDDHDSIGEKFEQLTALLELREKRIKKLEIEAEVYAKDKRSLNHQIGLMKTEMVQMKNTGDELQRVVELRDEEIRYLKTKMTEAIEEYEQVRQQEMNAREETNRYADEVGRLQHQVQILSSVGTATQQAETNDVVRQIRERHAKEVAIWQAAAADLESQLQIYKRGQQNALHESVILDLQDAAVQTDYQVPIISTPELETFDRSCQVVEADPHKVTLTQDAQTDPVPSPEISLENCATQTDRVETVERRISAMNLQNNIRRADFGQSVDLTAPSPITDEKVAADDKPDSAPMSMQEYEISVIEKWKVALAKAEEEKHKLIDFYEKEVEEYKTKLAVMPSKLYDVWNKQQEDLGLIFGRSPTGRKSSSSLKRPILIDVATQATVESPVASHISTQTASAPLKTSKDAQTEPASNDFVAQLRHHESPSSRSVTGTFSEKETSSVVIQTEETLETFNMLGDLIQGWAKEVKQSQLRAERAEKQAYGIAEKYVKLEKSLKGLKKDSREREIYLRQKCEEQRLQFLNVLSKVSSKLDVVVE